MGKRSYFGTDGIRGQANLFPMTPEVALRAGMAAGKLFRSGGDRRHLVVIGKDTRLSGYMIEPALVAGFTSVGMDVRLFGPLPTPAVAVMTRSIIGILQNMAAEVEVPPEDLAQHRAVPGFEAGRTLSGIVPMIRIHSAKNKPADAFVVIHYRDTWFWIDDRDLSSKRSFAQLMQAFTMADTGVRENLPIVTIPSR